MNDKFGLIADNIEKIRREMDAYPAARLMAVIKTRTQEEIQFTIRECGLTLVGENRVQEMTAHGSALDGAEVHFIGTLQKNKVKYLTGKVSAAESVDSFELAAEISRRSAAAGIVTDVLFEVNTGRETQKSGVFPEDLPRLIYDCASLPAIRARGLMTVAPICDSGAERRKYFALLRKLKDENSSYFVSPILSMGMSDSYREALDEGADIVRIGTGIFGKRE